MHEIFRNFLRWTPPQSVEKATQTCKYFLPIFAKFALHGTDVDTKLYEVFRSWRGLRAVRLSSYLPLWFSFVSHNPEESLLEVQGPINLKCIYRGMKKESD